MLPVSELLELLPNNNFSSPLGLGNNTEGNSSWAPLIQDNCSGTSWGVWNSPAGFASGSPGKGLWGHFRSLLTNVSSRASVYKGPFSFCDNRQLPWAAGTAVGVSGWSSICPFASFLLSSLSSSLFPSSLHFLPFSFVSCFFSVVHHSEFFFQLQGFSLIYLFLF